MRPRTITPVSPAIDTNPPTAAPTAALTAAPTAATTPLHGVRGDATGLLIPAHPAALRTAGAAFLTAALQAYGTLAADNRVTRIARFEDCPGGSTGRKVFLSLEYAKAQPGLHADLFVKFSRDFDDRIRDRGRYELESEVRFAALSRQPGFPISVPVAYFADYHRESGTGMLVTQRIRFGADGIEAHIEKCLDHELDQPLAYYESIVKALARLAAAHKSGRLASSVAEHFPFDPAVAAAGDPIRHDGRELRALVSQFANFAATYPRLFPAAITEPQFVQTLQREVGRFVEHETTIKRFLHGNPDYIALCHWNAHIDNAWFWRDAAGELQCGLLDWGRVRQLNLAFALWGCLSAAGFDIWERHLDQLLTLFVDELHAHGGPRLDVAELQLHLRLYVATMGLAWLMESPPRILQRLPEAAGASGPHDPVFRNCEQARNLLHIFSLFLLLWRSHDFGASLDQLLARTPT